MPAFWRWCWASALASRAARKTSRFAFWRAPIWSFCAISRPSLSFSFSFFFLSQQLIDALDLNTWARGIARGENAAVWEVFFGDMHLFPSLISGVIVLALFESAFVGEIVRAGIQSVPGGQREAARAIGMGPAQEMRFIVLPQAIRKVTPPMANQFISLIKDSSIISLISVQDLTYKTVELVASTRLIFEAWITAAVMYFILCFGLSLLFRWLERRG